MSSARFNYFYRVEITVQAFDETESDLISTQTFNFINKTIRYSTGVFPTYTEYMWPLLVSVGEIGYEAGETIPNSTISSIVLRNSRGSFGPAGKISDLFERFSPVDQVIKIYVAELRNLDDEPATLDWAQIAEGKVGSWECGLNSPEPTVTLNVEPNKFKDRVLNLIVSRNVPGMENAPESSLGRPVPLIIGEQWQGYSRDIIPLRISPDGLDSASYAIGTGYFGLLAHNPSLVSVDPMTKNSIDEWVTFYSGTIFNFLGTTATGSHGLNTYSAQAFLLTDISDANLTKEAYAVTGVTLSGKGNSTNPSRVSSAQLTVFILKVDSVTKAVVDTVASGRAYLSVYDPLNNASTAKFDITISFDSIAVLTKVEGSKSYEYYLGWTVTDHGGAQELSINYEATTVASLRQNLGDTNSSASDWKLTTGNRPLYRLNHVTVTLSSSLLTPPPTQDGLNYSSAALTQLAAATGQVNPVFDNFPFALTGVPGLSGIPVDEPVNTVDAAIAFSYEYVDGAWVSTNSWDNTTLYLSHYVKLMYPSDPSAYPRARELLGIFSEEITYTQLLTEICRGTACRVGFLNYGKAFIYPWGLNETVVVDIPYCDIIPLNWSQRDSSGVINQAIIKLNRSVILSPRIFENPYFENGGLTYSVDFSAENYAAIEDMTRKSRALYGSKSLTNNQFSVWPLMNGEYLGGGTSGVEGGILAEYYLTRYASPDIFCSFIVPWHRYAYLKMFDVITFSHPEFPAYYGTDSLARTPVVDTGSSVVEVPDANNGEELIRAKTYRGQIEGLSYIMAMEHAPAIRLTVRILQNHPIDPT